ncbi:hypothetical protein [Leptospira sp. GIMC2001]|uniref:hypothetical protein n=1 Tax=Leptospira sp. GIMC2001 TaxID=1513297 RepID=UPI00234ABDC1|nr:hypothetical protein [Leptospira sp. GIMC2001]WCL48673.1 hypothetical protein O4O04_15380 [Leptospira sp. GIMC2001]
MILSIFNSKNLALQLVKFRIKEIYKDTGKNFHFFIKIQLNVFVFATIAITLGNCINNFRDNWVRSLPPEYSQPNWKVDGKWVRVTPPKSAMNSQYHKNTWGEVIEFQSESIDKGTFQKRYWKEDMYGTDKKREEFIFDGTYKRSGNWILLTTLKKRDVLTNKLEEFDAKLLYHYDSKENNLAPMLYETGGVEKEFGILYETKNAYMEDEFFFRARKNFTKKEFQAHAYESYDR